MALLSTIMLAGCGKKNPLIGTWRYDAEKTQSELPKDDGDSGLLGGLGDILTGVILGQMGATEITITDKEYVMMNGGSGEAMSYEIFGKPQGGIYRLKMEDGKVHSFQRKKDWLVGRSTGNVDFEVYFRRVE